MKEFFINFGIDMAIKLAVSIYHKKGEIELKKMLKKIAFKIDISLDKTVRNENSLEIRKLISDIILDISTSINNPELKRDNSK